MKRVFLTVCGVLALSACAAPDAPFTTSNRGVGFGDYNAYSAEQQRRRFEREQQLAGAGTTQQDRPEETGAPTPQQALADPVISAQATGAQVEPAAPVRRVAVAESQSTFAAPPAPEPVTTAALTPVEPTGAPLSALREQPVDVASAPQAITPASPSVLSGGQQVTSLSAPSSTVERTPVEQVAVAPVPTRRSDGAPNIVDFALQTSHDVGQPVYRRTFGSGARASRVCGRYASPDLAQEAFLSGGGPERDRRGMDPDGDGFACGWDPRPFRLARGG
ncbi:MAG: hypothetical protein AAFQ66_20225 [Pseudomonadota bacterium]